MQRPYKIRTLSTNNTLFCLGLLKVFSVYLCGVRLHFNVFARVRTAQVYSIYTVLYNIHACWPCGVHARDFIGIVRWVFCIRICVCVFALLFFTFTFNLLLGDAYEFFISLLAQCCAVCVTTERRPIIHYQTYSNNTTYTYTTTTQHIL